MTSGIYNILLTSSFGARRATCSTARPSVLLIFSPVNMAARLPARSAASARLNSISYRGGHHPNNRERMWKSAKCWTISTTESTSGLAFKYTLYRVCFIGLIIWYTTPDKRCYPQQLNRGKYNIILSFPRRISNFGHLTSLDHCTIHDREGAGGITNMGGGDSWMITPDSYIIRSERRKYPYRKRQILQTPVASKSRDHVIIRL